ncbi:peptidoglycan-binding protein [Cohaesibacter sp. CAU 1516]|uniref:L,D-transpeptidase family protein n=1 Tax=Cohaesibacter sp. CAU 1516 TaxID=2576038 RepID=UPI0010FEBE09|nr:L,D-transpeptidase family protein [Cohaesibacter sp. CAU 1516]TLP42813.1 peptidoglycan-binding protein [Cohaesibacter sp. CAU 1516]
MPKMYTAMMAITIAAAGSALCLNPSVAAEAGASSIEASGQMSANHGPLRLLDVQPSAGFEQEIANRIQINTILTALRQTDTGIDQQRDQDLFDAVAAKIDAIPRTKDFLEKRDNAALVAFYETRNFQTAWFDNGEWTDHARKLVFALSRADRDGLDPADYQTPSLALSRQAGSANEDIAQADIALSLALTRYTRHAYAGRIDPRSFPKKAVTIKPHYPDSIAALDKILVSSAPVETLRSYNPQHQGFLALRKEYNRLRFAGRKDQTPPVPSGKSLKVGMSDERVPLIWRKLGETAPSDNPTLYSEALAGKIETYQAKHGLIADGIVGNATLRVMNDDRKELISDLIANLERWRWLPRDLGDFHVMVNIPTFHVQVVEQDKTIHETRVVVGKSQHKTPIFSDQMEYLVVNPYWNVPRSIASNELLPKIKSDPSAFFSKTNYQVLASVKGRTQIIDPSKLDWEKVDATQVRLRQMPGTRNALGNIKFMFPNQHAVYLHDTPSRSLFNRDYRAFSHGCVRVHEPMEFAEVILSRTKGWNAARVKKMIGGNERRVNLANKIPVHLAYFTTWMSDDGVLQVRSDIYGHNERTKKALGL